MVTRRRFLSAAAAGAAMFARIPNVLAATYDLVVKGGRVIDPSLGIDAVRDVAVFGGGAAPGGGKKKPGAPPKNQTPRPKGGAGPPPTLFPPPPPHEGAP